MDYADRLAFRMFLERNTSILDKFRPEVLIQRVQKDLLETVTVPRVERC